MKKIITILVVLSFLIPASTALARRSKECKWNVPWDKDCRRESNEDIKDYKEHRKEDEKKKTKTGQCRGHWSFHGSECRRR